MADQLASVADRIAEAVRANVDLDPPSEAGDDLDHADAYRVQELVAERLGVSDSPVCGYKVAMFGEPFFGRIRRRDVVHHRSTVSMSELLRPRVEPELLFVMGEELAGSDLIYTDVLRATDFVIPSIEIIVSRFRPDATPTRGDVIAANSSYAKTVISGRPAAVDELDVADLPVTLSRNGDPARRGGSERPAVSPVHAVLGLAATLDRLGLALRPGDIVMTGSCADPLPVEAGDTVTAAFEGLGSVSVAFGP